MTLRLRTAPLQNIGAGPHGTRVTFPITGGSFDGDRLRGKVLPGGADWVVKRGDGVLELDLRITLETDDGALIHMTFEGIRDDGAPGAPYFRTLPRFETADAKYSFLNRLLAFGTGRFAPTGVHMIEKISLKEGTEGGTAGYSPARKNSLHGAKLRTTRPSSRSLARESDSGCRSPSPVAAISQPVALGARSTARRRPHPPHHARHGLPKRASPFIDA
jgi:hypothetical protein